ncbi:hypothetical protein F5Y15DRAFT_66956 [Xylariaceae sp. FL0016]|nr:hypothetical protein F5Y15DRAFT_66956 [Xylariaceae sp. FL0016]
MAEPVAIVAALASFGQVTGFLLRITRDLKRCVKTVRKAPEEVQFLACEAVNFTGTMTFFQEIAKEASDMIEDQAKKKGGEYRSRKEQRVEMVQSIKQQCDCVLMGMERLVERFKKVIDEGNSSLENWWLRVMWFLDKPGVDALRLSLGNAMTTVNALSTLFLLEEKILRGINDKQVKCLRRQIKLLLEESQEKQELLVKHNSAQSEKQDPIYKEICDEVLNIAKKIETSVGSTIKTHDRDRRGREKSSRRSSTAKDNGRNRDPPSRRGSGFVFHDHPRKIVPVSIEPKPGTSSFVRESSTELSRSIQPGHDPSKPRPRSIRRMKGPIQQIVVQESVPSISEENIEHPVGVSVEEISQSSLGGSVSRLDNTVVSQSTGQSSFSERNRRPCGAHPPGTEVTCEVQPLKTNKRNASSSPTELSAQNEEVPEVGSEVQPESEAHKPRYSGHFDETPERRDMRKWQAMPPFGQDGDRTRPHRRRGESP